MGKKNSNKPEINKIVRCKACGYRSWSLSHKPYSFSCYVSKQIRPRTNYDWFERKLLRIDLLPKPIFTRLNKLGYKIKPVIGQYHPMKVGYDTVNKKQKWYKPYYGIYLTIQNKKITTFVANLIAEKKYIKPEKYIDLMSKNGLETAEKEFKADILRIKVLLGVK